MNHILLEHLKKFILVFFDGILIYNKSLKEHLHHLELAFEMMLQHQLLAKKSKCVFSAKRVEYLGHYIFAEDVSTDPKKVEAVRSWPKPQSVTQLRDFLGLTGYYRRFIKGYGISSKPLTDMLKKDNVCWNEKSSTTFQQLKEALTTTHVLILQDFSLMFVVETDACNMGIGAFFNAEGTTNCIS